MSQPRKSARKKRQTQLTFTPLPSSSPQTSHFTPAAVRYNTMSGTPGKKCRTEESVSPAMLSSPSRDQISSSERQKVQVVMQSPRKKREGMQLPTPAVSSQPQLDEISPFDTPQKVHKRELKLKALQPVFGGTTARRHGSTDTSSSSEGQITPVKSRRRKPQAPPVELSSDESSESHLTPGRVTPKKRSRLRQGFRVPVNGVPEGNSPKVLKTDLQRKISDSPRLLRSSSQQIQKSRNRVGDVSKATPSTEIQAVVIPSGTEQSSSDEEVITPARRRKNVPHPLTMTSDSEQNFSEDEVVTPRRRRLNRPEPRDYTQKGSSSDEIREIDNDLADLSDNEVQGRRTRGHQINSERSKRQLLLEKLRSQRTREVDTIEDEDEEDSPGTEIGSESEPIDQAMGRDQNLDEYENDFLDDEDDTIGVDLGVADVPIELTYHANKKPFEHFKTEVEWMVHNKINPAFDRRDEIYLLAHKKLDKEVEGYGSSKFKSSVWKESFVKALKNRPNFDRYDIPTMLEHKCEACQRSNHPPKHRVAFNGKAYDRDTLEAIVDDDDDDGSGSSEEDTESDKEESFFLGRHCCANAEMYHALHHWRYILNETVLLWLASDKHLTREKILERESKRQKKREKEANKIVDMMETTGVMKDLYRQFKQSLEAARDAKPERYARR